MRRYFFILPAEIAYRRYILFCLLKLLTDDIFFLSCLLKLLTDDMFYFASGIAYRRYLLFCQQRVLCNHPGDTLQAARTCQPPRRPIPWWDECGSGITKYDNTPMQNTANFNGCKNDNFLIFAQNIIMYTPVNPSFTI